MSTDGVSAEDMATLNEFFTTGATETVTMKTTTQSPQHQQPQMYMSDANAPVQYVIDNQMSTTDIVDQVASGAVGGDANMSINYTVVEEQPYDGLVDTSGYVAMPTPVLPSSSGRSTGQGRSGRSKSSRAAVCARTRPYQQVVDEYHHHKAMNPVGNTPVTTQVTGASGKMYRTPQGTLSSRGGKTYKMQSAPPPQANRVPYTNAYVIQPSSASRLASNTVTYVQQNKRASFQRQVSPARYALNRSADSSLNAGSCSMLPPAIYRAAKPEEGTSSARLLDTDVIVDGLKCDQLELPGVDINTMPPGSILRVTPQTEPIVEYVPLSMLSRDYLIQVVQEQREFNGQPLLDVDQLNAMLTECDSNITMSPSSLITGADEPPTKQQRVLPTTTWHGGRQVAPNEWPQASLGANRRSALIPPMRGATDRSRTMSANSTPKDYVLMSSDPEMSPICLFRTISSPTTLHIDDGGGVLSNESLYATQHAEMSAQGRYDGMTIQDIILSSSSEQAFAWNSGASTSSSSKMVVGDSPLRYEVTMTPSSTNQQPSPHDTRTINARQKTVGTSNALPSTSHMVQFDANTKLVFLESDADLARIPLRNRTARGEMPADVEMEDEEPKPPPEPVDPWPIRGVEIVRILYNQGYLTRESIVANVPYVCRAWHTALDNVQELWWQCDLTGTSFDDNAIYEALARRKPQELRLGESSIDRVQLELAIKGNDRLKSLSLTGLHFSITQALNALDSNLQALYLNDMRGCTDGAMGHFIHSWGAERWEKLQELYVADTELSDSIARLLSNKCRQLILLDMSGCVRMTDVALDALSAAGCPTKNSLRVLRISRCNHMNVSQVFSCVQRLERLETLEVSGCAQFTSQECDMFDDGLAAIKSKLVLIR